MTEVSKYRMYFFVPYNLSDIQKGIQAGHCALEYAQTYGHTKEYKQFIKKDKTWIILNGGTTRSYNLATDLKLAPGSLNEIKFLLRENQIPHASFEEPDLELALTAVCFLAEEKIWDKENYPDYVEDGYLSYHEWKKMVMGNDHKAIFLRELLRGKRPA